MHAQAVMQCAVVGHALQCRVLANRMAGEAPPPPPLSLDRVRKPNFLVK